MTTNGKLPSHGGPDSADDRRSSVPQQLSSEELAAQLLDELFGSDDDSDDAMGTALHTTGGDLTFGEDVAVDESFLQGLREDLDRFKDHEVVSNILGQGSDLREFAREVEEKLRQVELESIQDYMKESDNLLALHAQIKDCDFVLTHMESLLGGFQADLGAVSAEIKDLQERSMGMAQRLRNRRAAEGRLGRFVEEMAVSPDLIDTVVDGEVGEGYIRALQALNRKLHFVAEEPSARSSTAMRDVQPELDRLRVKAVIKGREYLMQKIYALRKPKTNIHILQQNVLLKYKYLAVFLKEHGRVVYTEVNNAYIDIMSKVLSLHLRTYISSLEKLQLDIVSRTDLIGVDDSNKLAQTIFGRAGRDLKNRSAVFSLGSRDQVLSDVEEPAIIPHIAEADKNKHPYEVLFRSLHKLLIDTATSEFLFCKEFFGDDSTFHAVFAGPFAVIDEHFAAVLPNCYDAIGLLLMIRMTRQFQDIMKARKVNCLDQYFDKVNLLLWPRFKLVFDLHLGSLRQANPRALWEQDVHPHYVARRYAEFAASLMTLNTAHGDGQLELNLDRLRSAVDHLLVEISRLFPKPKQRTVFLINNYDLILAVLKEAGVEEGRTQRHFAELLSSFSTIFVEEELHEYFRGLVDFVKKRTGTGDETADAVAARSSSGSTGGHKVVAAPITAKEVEPHLKDFAVRWKATIDLIHKDIITNFSNFVCGMDILRAALTQLLLYYTRLSDCLKRVEGGASLMKDVVSIPSIMYEIRKYSLTF
ncbi:hypothetical protein CLOM_g9206 [Closterium sp. NIES-68]|nr:hypothetical protein CLOM_g9206 [Closterium sp. NIES-68]GJP61431.1 hypothetical protein CLOP_g18596 [Closterium sp. NIES-67]